MSTIVSGYVTLLTYTFSLFDLITVSIFRFGNASAMTPLILINQYYSSILPSHLCIDHTVYAS